MTKRYYTLLTRADADDAWAIEFGDYVKGEVACEQRNLIDAGYFKRKNTLIISSDDDQKSIQDAVNAANIAAGHIIVNIL